MNRFAQSLAVLLSSLSLGSCLSFKVKAPLPSENRLEMIEVCRDVNDAGESLTPSDPRAEFTRTDGQVCCFIRVRSAAADVRLRWKWYAPDKKLWKDTGTVAVDKGQGDFSVITAYDFIRTDAEDIPPGEWTVAVFMNDVLIGRKTFSIGQAGPFGESRLWKGRGGSVLEGIAQAGRGAGILLAR